MKVLVIEDDPDCVESLALCLELRWPEAKLVSALNGEKGLELARTECPDVIILDLGLPDVDGFDVLCQLRSFSKVPVVILTAREKEMDKVTGLELGADDYIVKPFAPAEFLSRVKAVVRRSQMPEAQVDEKPVVMGKLQVDFAAREASIAGKPLGLNPEEYRLLLETVVQRDPGGASAAEASHVTGKAGINGIELYYELHGRGEPLVFLHGWLGDCSVWDPQIEPFAQKHSVLVYDHRGHGRSDKPEGSYAVKTLASDLFALMQELNLEKVTLVGHSMGGMTALIFALDHPDMLSKLVLVGTTAKMPFSVRVSVIARHFLPYRTFVRLAQKSRYHKPSEQVLKNSVDMAMNTPKHAAYACLAEFTGNYDFRNRVSEIEVPTLIVVGEKDKSMLPMSHHLNREIKGSRLRIVAGSGHEVMVEKPGEFRQVLEAFIG